MSLFGSAAAKPAGFNFGSTAANNTQPQSSLFGTNTNQQKSLFGNTQAQALTTQPAPSGGLFGNTGQQNNPGLFGNTQNQQAGGLFGNNQNQQSSGGLFGSSLQPMNNLNGASQQQQERPLDQTLRFGFSQSQQTVEQARDGKQPLWKEGRGLGVYRSIPAQMGIVKDKWDPASLTSPLRTYLYQHVGDEAEALKYRPAEGEDENKWEEAVGKRPGETWVPLLVRGFFELGKKAQIQMEAIKRCNMMLQEINTSLDIQLDTHRQAVAARLAECKRRHTSTSQRTLALAVKVQLLRNRGYVMDNAEEELKLKLEKLEREVLDPSLNAREQDIWARMLGIRERAKWLKTEMDRIAPAAQNEEPLLNEETVKAAKKTLEAYDKQLRHLQSELQLVREEFADWEKSSNGNEQDRPRRR